MLPNESRAFVHKRIIAGVGGFISGGPVSGITGFIRGGQRSQQPEFTGSNRGGGLGFAPRGFAEPQCPRGQTRARDGSCRRTAGAAVGDFFSPGTPFSDTMGEAVMGRYGPALVPAEEMVATRRCPTGAVLGDDGLCYDKGTHGARRAHRLWKPERPPFLPRRDLAALDRVAALKRNKVLKRRFKALGLG